VAWLRSHRRLAGLSCACVLFMLAGWGLLAYLRGAGRGLPYRDSFAHGRADEWKAFGGTWELVDGAMRNDSDERGAKLLTGSLRWSDYSIDADVRLLGLGGDAGLVVRSSDEEQGVNAYTGYYAGLRSIDNSLVLGRADHGWLEVWDRLDPKEFRVEPAQWYHLRLLAFGCQVAATVTTPTQIVPITIAATDDDCVRAGRVGLRSYASGGVWRNVVVRSATQRDLAQMLATLGPGRAYSLQNPLSQERASWDYYGSDSGSGPGALPSSPNAQPISTLRLKSLTKPVMATVRGVVVLASPALFVEDSTGGISVQAPGAQALKVGDEVEATGTLHAGAFSATLERATVRVLWEGTPLPAVSVTASQAATGAFDATFIEVQGRLVRKQYGRDDTLIFDFDAGPQSFRAIINRGRGDYLYRELKTNSMLRIRGIAVSDQAYTHNLVPFAILLRSTDDAIVVAGPPWWDARYLLAFAMFILFLAMVANFIYHRVESWRLRAVLEERERLAYEMHDTLSQSFAGIGFQLEAIREAMPGEAPRLNQQLELACELVRHSHEETRRSIAVLRPEQPARKGLLEALATCANYLVEGGSVRVIATSTGDIVKIPLRVADTLYRIGQEAIANAVAHGHPSTIVILVAYEKGRVSLSIEDDGEGFTPSEDIDGFGMRGMGKRAGSILAQLDVQSRPGQGTCVSVVATLPARATLLSWLTLSQLTSWRHIRNVTAGRKLYPHPDRR
jgi:signal transduction histidine kinase